MTIRSVKRRAVWNAAVTLLATLVLIGLPSTPAGATVSGENGVIAFVSGGDGDIYVMNPDGSGQLNLSQNPATDSSPAWSPDGRRLAFTSTRGGETAVYIMSSDGSDQTFVTAGDSPAWSPDGKRIAFVRNDAIWVLTLSGSAVQVSNPESADVPEWATSVLDHSPTWAPDGRTIAFVRHARGPTPTARFAQLMTIRSDGSGLRTIPNVGAWGLATPDWSPDGSRIVVVEQAPLNISDHVVLIDTDGSDRVVLPIPAGFDTATEVGWSPDGEHLMAGFAHTLGTRPLELVIMNPDGSDQTELGVGGRLPAWQPLNPYPVGAFDPSTGIWWLRHSNASVKSFYYGNPADLPFMGDWDCDGVETPGLYRASDGFIYLRNSNTQGIADISFLFGNPGDVPIAGDFDGDGCDTVSLYRPSDQHFYIINELGSNGAGLGAADYSFVFGNPADRPLTGDFDGDGIEEVALHRASTGKVYIRLTLTSGFADLDFYYGNPGDRMVAHDWNGDGNDSPAIFRPGNTTFFFRFTNSPGVADAHYIWGEPDWLPVAGDFGG